MYKKKLRVEKKSIFIYLFLKNIRKIKRKEMRKFILNINSFIYFIIKI